MKEAVIAQQHALAEQRARAVKGDYYEDEYNSLHDDYKGSGGFTGGDAKKRRGVSFVYTTLPYMITNRFNRKLHHLDDVTAVIEQKPQNGEEVRTVLEPFAMRAGYITPN